MGDIKNIPPCVRFIGAFSRSPESLDWLWQRVDETWGTTLLRSPQYAFVESNYYHSTMGEGLIKQFAICSEFYDPSELPSDKNLTNHWEAEFASDHDLGVARPLNIDPGYLGLTKLVLASTKNREHRLYMRDGIYAEVTLAFRSQAWQAMEWTYPDYQREDFQAFFTQAREAIKTISRAK